MSDMTETAVTVETPVVTEAVEAPKDAASARRSIHDRASGRVTPQSRTPAAEVNNAVERPRDEQGRFAAVNETPASEPSVAATAPTPETATTEAAPPSDANRIQIPDGHPLRDRGRQYLDELTPEESRSLFNNPVKQRDVEQSRREAQELRMENARLKAEAAARKEIATQAFSSPEVVARYAEIREAWGEVEAQRYLRGVEAEYEATITARSAEASAEVEGAFAQEAALSDGYAFIDSVTGLVASRVEAAMPGFTRAPAFAELFNEALVDYSAKLQVRRDLAERRGENPAAIKANEAEFLKTFSSLYAQHPDVLAFFRGRQQEDDEKRINEAAARREREALDAARNNRNTNALGRLPSGSAPATLPVTTGPRNAQEARQQVRQRLRGAA